MKVRRVVEMLYQTYDPDQEIMALWFGSEHFETKAGVWDMACRMFDEQNYPYELNDHVQGIIQDAQAEVEMFEQLAIDHYLERTREDEANV